MTQFLLVHSLRKDDFQGFIDARTKALASLVAAAMGKAVVEEHGSNEKETEPDPSVEEGADVEESPVNYQEVAQFV